MEWPDEVVHLEWIDHGLVMFVISWHFPGSIFILTQKPPLIHHNPCPLIFYIRVGQVVVVEAVDNNHLLHLINLRGNEGLLSFKDL